FRPLLRPLTSSTYPLSLHDALPISHTRGRCPAFFGTRARSLHLLALGFSQTLFRRVSHPPSEAWQFKAGWILITPAGLELPRFTDRKSTRLNSSHVSNSYAVF